MKCEYEGCEKEANTLAGDSLGVKNYCEGHADAAVRYAEYVVCCPNCGCMLGVG